MCSQKEKRPGGAPRLNEWIRTAAVTSGFSMAMFATAASAGAPERGRAADSSAALKTRLFFAIFDCSWRNTKVGPTGPTTAALIHDQLDALQQDPSLQIHVERVETDCARDNWFTRPDQGKPVFDQRLEQMRKRLATQSERWLKQTPGAQINVVSIGGSWGAAQAAAFSRMLDQQGIRPGLAGKESGTGKADRPAPLMTTHRPSQVTILLDPVGAPDSHLPLPPSVIAGLQVVAGNEKRPEFRSIPIIAKGLSEDRRFLGVTVAGSHSDICGGYKLNGLATRTFNLVVDYVNSLSDTPLLRKQAVPTDPALSVIHDSTEEVI